jgi:hypothetical protein
MAITADEARRQILDDLGGAIDKAALAVASLGEAFEQLPEGAGDRLETELFRPVQRAYALGKRTHAGFAARNGLESGAFELPSPGLASQGAAAFVQHAASAAADGDRRNAELQDSMLPVEVGDPEVRAGLSEVRTLVGDLPAKARRLGGVVGR